MANFCRVVTITNSGILIPLNQIPAYDCDKQNRALHLKNITKQLINTHYIKRLGPVEQLSDSPQIQGTSVRTNQTTQTLI